MQDVRQQNPDSHLGLAGDDAVAEQLELSVAGEPEDPGDVPFGEPHHPLDEVRTEHLRAAGAGHRRVRRRTTEDLLVSGDSGRVLPPGLRSEERRVGRGWRTRWE